jgi:hypothetical protein
MGRDTDPFYMLKGIPGGAAWCIWREQAGCWSYHERTSALGDDLDAKDINNPPLDLCLGLALLRS